ncbi:hypothetical protein ACELLULO517_05340 [Acidisoma cellulosilytica]|uniref:Uncharacterized protein n=1 Tax=Acidisoma cellulosilyticum TaxID=2802395 RepID=A0A963YYX9_9PROT|nr:hypothetical protein [Acidisoma cellulosilyticum]MCB8879649.1 hypothetical protein [Acidisoma cellulosilyticum]
MTDETRTTQQPETDAVRETSPADKPADGISAPADRRPVDDRQRLQPLLTLAGFIILAGGIVYLWTRPVPEPSMPPMPPDQTGVVAALKSEVSSLQSAVYSLDTRERADVAALHEAIANIQTSPSGAALPTATPAPSSPPDAGSGTAIAALTAQMAQLQATQSAQAQASQSLPSAASVATLSSRVDAVAQQQGTDADALHQQIAGLTTQINQLSAQAQSLTQSTKALPQLSAQSDRLTRLLHAEAALSAGAPLGDIPNAPAALSQFATTAPPTEAALVLAYPQAAAAADKAGGPADTHTGFWHGIWMRVQTLVTVRQGDHVLVGDPTSGVLAHAQRLLVAGDLPGALTVLKTLQGPAAAAMAGWTATAQSLVDARQALAQMAAG